MSLETGSDNVLYRTSQCCGNLHKRDDDRENLNLITWNFPFIYSPLEDPDNNYRLSITLPKWNICQDQHTCSRSLQLGFKMNLKLNQESLNSSPTFVLCYSLFDPQRTKPSDETNIEDEMDGYIRITITEDGRVLKSRAPAHVKRAPH